MSIRLNKKNLYKLLSLIDEYAEEHPDLNPACLAACPVCDDVESDHEGEWEWCGCAWS